MVLHLLPVPADTDPEHGSARGDKVEGGHLLGRDDRVPLGHQCDAGAQQDPLGHRGGRAERDERVEGAVVDLRQLTTGRVRRAAVHRDVGVLGDEQGVERSLLDGAPERGGRDALVGDEG